MASSMTAFSRCEYRGELGELVWEVRSVNHRYLECFVRLPEELRALEPAVRELVGKRLARGKVDCNLRYTAGMAIEARMQVNEQLARQLVDAGRRLAGIAGSEVALAAADLMRWPGVLEVEEQDLTPVQAKALGLLDDALGSLLEVRKREGARLAEIIGQRCDSMRGLVGQARKRMPEVLEEIRQRIRSRLQEVLRDLDENRLEQEMALLAQRLDVDEEVDRLAAHLDEVGRALGHKEPVGRHLDFLMQELNREANTLASKSSDVELTRIAVDMKVLIEQMREQVQNLE